jgi:AcrR family transcriptional regulator
LNPVKAASEKTTGAPRPPTKARILQVAQEVFAERGFDGASTREIAGRAGVNISSLHYHWDSKETLYVAVFEHIFRQLVDLVKDEITRPTSAEQARAMIEKTMGITFDFLAADPTIPKLLMRRLIESTTVSPKRERGVMGPTWRTFENWTKEFSGDRLASEDVSFVLLTVQSVLLVSMLDSPHIATMLGGTIRSPALRGRLRQRIIELVEKLMDVTGA